ncbi:hypothetical protein K450DRAFT_252018 [Umbelopsis ramanniana AG]|uniref:Cysteine protease n=1 Tax=Umbelopsis ramanniana AG TaxID=1314678 RepID=A0AAD5E671_UMBRA|nr:uncharacterized protein K450DRAFT_252018 [Umbelopsis ramanniana AG]KAI8577509.1 hypothetical protein K450DRAFT_252018 [Umbelopsis ramanniana AG]
MQSASEVPDSNNDRSQSDASLDMVSEAPSADKLPLPQNFNNLGNAPLADRILSNSSYLAAEIPHKIGNWAKNIWETSTDLSNSVLNRQGASLPGSWTGDSNQPDIEEAADLRNQGLWLLGCRYELPDNESLESKIIAAQAESMFDQQAAHSLTAVPDTGAAPESTSVTAHSDTPSTVSDAPPPTEKPANDSAEENTISKFAVSSLWPADFYEDFTSRLWYTYRHNYPPIRPANYKTDIGWGCMLRSGQSLLANTLMIHLLGRDWRRSTMTKSGWNQYAKIVHWFLDELSARAPFSIHRIALLGKQLGKNIGEWFGPSTIGQVIQALVTDYPPAKLTVYVTSDGVVYKKDVRAIAKGSRPRYDLGKISPRGSSEEAREERELHQKYFSRKIEMEESPADAGKFQSVLILAPIKPGIDSSINPIYYKTLKAYFQLPQFVGIAGGRPNSSLYFIGLQGDDLIYLDPHFSRSAVETKALQEYTAADFSSYHCSIPRKIHISHLDPSMLLGFYCRTEDDFNNFCDTLSKINQMYKKAPLLTVDEEAPEYDEDVRSEEDFGVISGEEYHSEHDDELYDELSK